MPIADDAHGPRVEIPAPTPKSPSSPPHSPETSHSQGHLHHHLLPPRLRLPASPSSSSRPVLARSARTHPVAEIRSAGARRDFVPAGFLKFYSRTRDIKTLPVNLLLGSPCHS